jgi:hypothetical protein
VLVPDNIYVVVPEGLATGDAHVVQDNPVEGLQAYVVAPVALSVTELPAQIAVSAPALTVGNGFTVTVLVAVLEQPALVPVTV